MSEDLTDPQSFNRYSYVGNDPVNSVDPSGLLVEGARCGVNWTLNPGTGEWTATPRSCPGDSLFGGSVFGRTTEVGWGPGGTGSGEGGGPQNPAPNVGDIRNRVTNFLKKPDALTSSKTSSLEQQRTKTLPRVRMP